MIETKKKSQGKSFLQTEILRSRTNKLKACFPPPASGRVVQVLGPVVDIVFLNKRCKLLDSLIISSLARSCCCEVQKLLSNGNIRTISLDPTDGLRRYERVLCTGHPIKVPVGLLTLGRIFNALGENVDYSIQLNIM